MSNNGGLWVFIEHKDGKIPECFYKLACEGKSLSKKLGKDLYAVIIGNGIQNLAETLGSYGVEKVFVAENKLLERYNSDAYVKTIADLANEYKPDILLFGATSISAELAPRIAAALNVSLMANCIEFELNDKGQIVGRKPAYGGNVHVTITSTSGKTLVTTIDTKALDLEKVADPKKPQFINVEPKIAPETIKTTFIDYKKANPRTIAVTEADVILAIGRGVEKAENLKMIEDLADVLGASIGGSRPAVDAGWVDHERQIGSSGKDISPTLHVVCGVSGAGHYTSGVRNCKFNVVINKDKSAAIFKIANIGVVGDLLEVIPELTKQLRAIKEKEKKN